MKKPVQKTVKSAFTLLEMMISVFLISLILFFLYSATNNFKRSNDFYAAKQEEDSIKELFFQVLYEDVLESDVNLTKVIKEDEKLDTLQLQTRNTHFNYVEPYVRYYVTREAELLRVESYELIDLPASLDDVGKLRPETIMDQVEWFKMKIKESKILVYLKREEENEGIVFELKRPY